MDLIEQIKQKATGIRSRIVLPEGCEERTLKAAFPVHGVLTPLRSVGRIHRMICKRAFSNRKKLFFNV